MPLELPLVAPGRPGSDLTAGQDGGAIVRRTVLPGGLRVLSEHVPGLRSATIGAWVPVGSRDERDGHFGSTHFLEHLLFKGTSRRTALDIAEAFDAVGGEANASTGKESTCYHARVLDTDLPMAVDVVTDMITSALIDPADLETERGVILEELAMTDDDPIDAVHEKFSAAVLGAHPLGRPIGGTPATIRGVPRDAVVGHYREHYRPHTLVVAAAGGVDHDELVAQVLEGLAAGGWDTSSSAVPVARRDAGAVGVQPAGVPHAGTELEVHRPTEQSHVIVGGTGITATDPRRYAMSVLSAILGGGMSSRLFQEIREKRGLVYTTYSFAQGYADTGTFGLYAGCAPERVEEVTGLLATELERMAQEPVSAGELERAVGQLSGGLVLGMEDTGARMARLGRAELVHGELASISEQLERIGSVTAADVQELAAELAVRPRSRVVVGPRGDRS